jgi:hypothetical protein
VTVVTVDLTTLDLFAGGQVTAADLVESVTISVEYAAWGPSFGRVLLS